MPYPTTVYHGCHVDSVRAIMKSGVQISASQEGDFNVAQSGRAFYTTADEDFAEYWSASKTDSDNDGAAVIQFKVNLDNLIVKQFPTDKTDTKYIGDWQSFVSRNWIDNKSSKKEKLDIPDVVSGFMSNAAYLWEGKTDKEPPPNKFLYKPEVVHGRPVTQVAFCSNKALDEEHIRFVSYKLWDLKEQDWSTYRMAIPKVKNEEG